MLRAAAPAAGIDRRSGFRRGRGMEGRDPAAVCYKIIPTATCGVISSSFSCRRFCSLRLIRRFTSGCCSFC